MNTQRPRSARRSFGEVLKDAFLFLASPFISLAYIALFPFIGLAMLLKTRSEERGKRHSTQ